MQPSEGRELAPLGNAGLVARLRQRLFPASSAVKPVAAPAAYAPDKIKAGIAELLLVNRLKARSTRKTQAKDVMERAAHIVFVTCKNWFTPTDGRLPERRTPL